MKINLTREKMCNVAKTVIRMTVNGPVTPKPIIKNRLALFIRPILAYVND